MSNDKFLPAGVLLGAGMGGLADGIVFHQILQWHSMISARVPLDTLVHVKVNMFWDGVFHAAAWMLTAFGLAALWWSGPRHEDRGAGRRFLGALLTGWGLFNVVEGILDHHLLDLHHVLEWAVFPLLWDLAYLASGALLIVLGARFMGRGTPSPDKTGVKKPIPPRVDFMARWG